MEENGKAMKSSIPSFRGASILLAMLSLSIGWGIRGNFGHEYGAMMPGALCALAVALFSGREDWRQRMPFFALFGAIGWGFGGSIAYMPVLGYTHSGHLPTQLYGFVLEFITGFLWAGLGGAGTAYAAVESREKLTAIFKPFCWILVLWGLQDFFFDDFVRWYEKTMVGTEGISGDFRQRNPFYWLDSEWVEATLALIGLCLFDLWDRRFGKIQWLLAFGAAGAAAGWTIQSLLHSTGITEHLVRAVVQYQGDLSAINPATGQPFDPQNFITNWPQLFFDLAPHLGWIFGLIAGVAAYFIRFGAWRSGSLLLLYMTLGSYLAFLIGPVLLSNFFGGIGGFRMMPPRGDSWANIVGVFTGMFLYMTRNGLKPVAFAGVLSGVLGGLGFMCAQFIKLLALMPGNPVLSQDPEVIQRWAHWRSANWHSILAEQGAGLFYGLAIAITMGVLATRVRSTLEEPRVRRWTEAFSIFFILNILVYVNLVKNVRDWTEPRGGGPGAVPLTMKAPLFGSIELSALGWFNVMFLLITICTVALLRSHMRRPLAVVPRDWLGKGQLFYLGFLWAIVIGNFERALVGFQEGRLATEGMIMANALLATYLILARARPSESVPQVEGWDFGQMTRRVFASGVAIMVVLTVSFATVVHGVYGEKADGWGNRIIRFGPEADWRVKPILKNKVHR